MKLNRILGIVVLIHILPIAVLLVQPGCKTTRDTTASQPEPVGPTSTRSPPPDNQRSVHPDFNAGVGTPTPPATTAHSGDRLPPRRPTPAADAQDFFSYSDEVLQPEPPPPAPAAAVTTYAVRSGDTLIAIARRHGVNLADLLAANTLSRDSVIRPGQELVIPGASSVASSEAITVGPEKDAEEPGIVYEVRRGDSLSSIARRHSVEVAEIRRANNLTGDLIRVGQQLFIPGPRAEVAPVTPSPQQAAAPVLEQPADGASYEVRSGDTLGGIARRYGVTVAALRAANDISGDLIRVGQILRIPTGGSGAPLRSETPKPTPTPAPQPVPSQPAPSSPPPLRQVPPPIDPMTLEELENLDPVDDEEIPLIPVDDVEEFEEEPELEE